MKLSTRGRYGTRAMVDLAVHHGNGSILLKDIAKRQEVSLKYLEQLITPLRAAGLVRGLRGARGGYQLARQPKEILLSEIINALEGLPAPVDCLTDKMNCSRSHICATQELWGQIYSSVNTILENRNLQDMANRQIELTGKDSKEDMYYI